LLTTDLESSSLAEEEEYVIFLYHAHGTSTNTIQPGNSGVKNQITAFDFSSRAPTVEPFAEIEASKDDSVTCLANLSTRDGVILYAGICGSKEDRKNGRNEHFQAFELRFPKGKEEKMQVNMQFLSKTKLFTTPQSDLAKEGGYQRIVKLSTPRTSNRPNMRIGAIASSIAAISSRLAGEENEIVIFSATSNKPTDQDVIGRITLHKGQEANDLDIFTQEEGRFRVAYVTDQDVFVQDVNYDFEQKKATDTNEHRKVYTIPSVSSGPKSKLRCVRWLSPKHLLLLSNKPNWTGAELLLLHLYEEGPGMIALRKKLPGHVKLALDMDVSLLDADDEGAYQIAIAVGALDCSLTVYTMDFHGPARDSMSSFHSFNSYNNVSRRYQLHVWYANRARFITSQ
jgi:prolactin regulatory element-binding protein